MNVLFLNGNPEPQNTIFDAYLSHVANILRFKKHAVTILKLRDMNIRGCTGCFDCWVKTPGECVMPDESRTVRREFLGSDVVLFASPVIMGFTSALLKRAQDKLIPLLHPYFAIIGREFHHRRRYEKYPLFGLLLEREDDTDAEDIEIIRQIFRRNALNFHTSLRFAESVDFPVEQAADAIDGIQRVPEG
jgi:multimeric flavodoxin WrbA